MTLSEDSLRGIVRDEITKMLPELAERVLTMPLSKKQVEYRFEATKPNEEHWSGCYRWDSSRGFLYSALSGRVFVSCSIEYAPARLIIALGHLKESTERDAPFP